MDKKLTGVRFLPVFNDVMRLMEIRKIDNLPSNLGRLLVESQNDGFRFVKRLMDDFDSGINRFDKRGEALFALMEDFNCVGIGGINVDPYASNEKVGRVRRVYIMKSHRGHGVGKLLMSTLESWAEEYFDELRLFTDTKDATAFYDSLGYERSKDEGVSHFKLFTS